MPRLLRKAYAGAKYHITVRGNARQRIFLDDRDRKRFLVQLQESLDQYGVILYAYVLMSNHYHLLIETPRGNVSSFMQRLNTAYSMYFRNRHKRAGHTLQGRFGGKLVGGDRYLLALTRYIHLNPVKIGTLAKRPKEERVGYLRNYRWSSYRGYVEKKAQEKMVDYRWRALVGGGEKAERKRYRAFVESMLWEDDEVLKAALRGSRYAVGDEGFVARIEDEVRRERERHGRRQSDIVWPSEQMVNVEQIKDKVAEAFGCSEGDLCRHGHVAGEAKSVAIGLACQLTGLSLREVGAAFGMTGAAAAYHARKLARERKARSRVNGLVERLLKVLKAKRDDI